MEVHGRAEFFKCVTPGCRYAHAESIRGASLHLVAADPASAASDGPACHAGPTPPTTMVGELPRCPACGAPSLPQALLFDEEYESHSYYQYRKARRWLGDAKAIVFVGTSFAVGVTEHALQLADERQLPCFSFNVRETEPSQAAAATGGAPMPNPVMHHITGPCEVTLPKLAALVVAPLATKTKDWFEGSAGEAEVEQLRGLGTEWTERTSGDITRNDGRSGTRGRGKKRDRPRAVPQHETNWVACDACGKWRKLPAGVRLEGEQAAGRWLCKHNVWDRKRQSCKAAEEPWA